MSAQVSTTNAFSPLADCTNDTLQAHNRANNAVCARGNHGSSGTHANHSGSTHRPVIEKPPVRWTRHNPYAACVLDPEHSVDYKDSNSAAPTSTCISGLTGTSMHEGNSVDISMVSRRGGYSVLSMPFISAVRSSSSPYARDNTASPLTYPSPLSAPHSCTQDEMAMFYHEANRSHTNYTTTTSNSSTAHDNINNHNNNNNNNNDNMIDNNNMSSEERSDAAYPSSNTSNAHSNNNNNNNNVHSAQKTLNNNRVHVVVCSAANSNRRMMMSVRSSKNGGLLSSSSTTNTTAQSDDAAPIHDSDSHDNEEDANTVCSGIPRSPSSILPIHSARSTNDYAASHSPTEVSSNVEHSTTGCTSLHPSVTPSRSANTTTVVASSSAARSKANNHNQSRNHANHHHHTHLLREGSNHHGNNGSANMLSSTSSALVNAVTSVMRRKNMTARDAAAVTTPSISTRNSHHHCCGHENKKHVCGGSGAAAVTLAEHSMSCRVEVRVDMRHTSADFVIDDVCHTFGSALGSEELLGRYVIVEGDRGEDMGSIVAIVGGDLPCMTLPSSNDDNETTNHNALGSSNSSSVEDGTGANGKENTTVGSNNNSSTNGNSAHNYKSSRVMLRVLRPATEEEICQLDELERDERKALKHCQDSLARVRLHVPIVIEGVIFQFDRKKLTVRYTSDSYVDFNMLTRALHNHYKCRIWMDQVNRDMCEGVHERRRHTDTKKRFVRGYGKRRDS